MHAYIGFHCLSYLPIDLFIHQNTPKPHQTNPRPDIQHLRPTMPAPVEAEPQAIQDDTCQASTNTGLPIPTPEAQAAENLLSLGEDDVDASASPLQRRRSSFEAVPEAIAPLSSSSTRPAVRSYSSTAQRSDISGTNNTTQSLSNLLSHHRSEQELLTEELATMASRLKMNSLEFSQLLEKDKSLLENAENQLDGNLSGMIKERDRLKAYKKSGGVTTWFVIGSVLAVLFAWLFMFAIMRVF